jgi:hypothetical protein
MVHRQFPWEVLRWVSLVGKPEEKESAKIAGHGESNTAERDVALIYFIFVRISRYT